MDAGHFHIPDTYGVSEEENANTRRFEGDGTPFLPIPGCKAVTAVKAAGAQLPPVLEYEVVVGLPNTREMRREPGFVLGKAPDGTPLLLRHMKSNDGVWQKGHPVYVTGEWEESPAKKRGKAA